MPADKKTINNLQTAAQMLAQLVEQYQIDEKNLEEMGLKSVAKCFKDWRKGAKKHLDIILERILYFNVDPDYEVGRVAGGDTVTELLTRASGLSYAAIEKFCDFRKQAWDAIADYTPDIYEHAIKSLEKHWSDTEKELNLIKTYGEDRYVLARLCK